MSAKDFLSVFQAFWGFWPLMAVAVLRETLTHARKGKFRSSLAHNLLLFWSFFAVLWVILALNALSPAGYILPQPLNSMLFWVTGLVLIAIKGRKILSKHGEARRMMRDTGGIADLLRLTPGEFERVVAETYRAFGNRVEIVAAQGDHGIDLVVHSPHGEKYVVQCKRWKGRVGEPVVRDFYGAMQHENAVEGAIVTSGDFTPQAREWAKGKPIRLFDGAEFLKVMRRAQKKSGQAVKIPVEPQPAPVPVSTMPPVCPQCGVPMVVRTAKRGPTPGQQFYGCPNYPNCRVIIRME